MTPTGEITARTPRVVILGATGAGKSEVAAALAELTGLKVVEIDSPAEQILEMPLQDAFITDSQHAEEVLLEVALAALEPRSPDRVGIVVLTPSVGADPAVLAEIQRCKQEGTTVVGLDAPLDVLARRAGLMAAQPGYLGTPRAWFRSMHGTLVAAYATVVQEWFDTESESPSDIAVQIARGHKLDWQPDTGIGKRE